MGMKLDMKSFHPQITNQLIDEILTGGYINMDGIGILYTILGHLTIDDIHRNLMV